MRTGSADGSMVFRAAFSALHAGGQEERRLGVAEALAPLAGSIEDRRAGLALAAGFRALADLLPPLQPAARLLTGLTAVSATEVKHRALSSALASLTGTQFAANGQSDLHLTATHGLGLCNLAEAEGIFEEARLCKQSDVSPPLVAQVDEVDYEARLAAYRQLQPATWRSIGAAGGAAVLLQRCFLDLRNGDDLTLRHAAAQALARFLEAAAAEGELQEGSAEERLVLKVVFASVKRSIAAQNLAVRQVSRTSATAPTECGGSPWPQRCYNIGDWTHTRMLCIG